MQAFFCTFRYETGKMEFIKKHYKLILFSIPIISFGLHFHVFDLDLVGIHVWRQTETQTVINNFYRESFNILHPHINDRPDTGRVLQKEFPLMQWLFAIFYWLLGSHITLSRVLSFIIGLFSVYGMFYLCNNVFRNKVIATICAWCFNFSPVFYYYTLNPMPDNMALCCAIWSIGVFYRYLNTLRTAYVICSAIFLGIATLVKLPFILYGSFMFTIVAAQGKYRNFSRKQLGAIFFAFLFFIIPACVWYITVIPKWDNGVVKGALDIKQNMSAWLYILWGNVSSSLPELLINYASVLFFIAGLYFTFRNKLYRNNKFYPFLFWGISIILYFLYELNMIDTVHDYYLFPFLPPIFILVAYGAYRLLLADKLYRIVSLVCLCVLPLTAFLRIDSRWDTQDPGFNPVYFKYEKELRNLTPQNAYCIVGNDPSHYILLYYIDRKGWAFDYDRLDGDQLSYYVSKGAKYLFLDSHIDDNPGIKAHLYEKIFDKETLRVYKLK